ncbi:MAG: FAD:protein FMN transferase [Melioribacteraceae bacterium]|nr:FAD:protein FMN transferase [Melioribacteraceae bacterium]
MKLNKTKYIILVSLVFLFSCDNKTNDPIKLRGLTMGTTYSVKIVESETSPVIEIPILKQKIDSVLIEVNDQMSTYIPESEISLFNKYKETDWFEVSDDFAFVLDESINMCELTEGSLDITVGPIVNIWGFGPDQRPRKIPSEEEIARNINYVGFDKLEVKFDPPSVKKNKTDLQIDLSATAKGFGVDKVFNLLSELGYDNFMVEIGGEVRTAGLNHKNEHWKIGVSEADHSGGINKVLELSNLAMATSGDYWNYFEEEGIRYSHTIDPTTGRPITHKLASVTVIDSTCLRADGLATGIFVNGTR